MQSPGETRGHPILAGTSRCAVRVPARDDRRKFITPEVLRLGHLQFKNSSPMMVGVKEFYNPVSPLRESVALVTGIHATGGIRFVAL